MKAYVDVWVRSDSDTDLPDGMAALTAIRAIEGVAMADWFFGPDDVGVVVEVADIGAFEAAINRIEAIPHVSLSNVRLARSS